MKTVMDAVNEFMGEWLVVRQDDDEQLALYLTSHNPEYSNDKEGEIYKGFTGFSEDKYLQVCTREEFLAAVAECENNFGQCDDTYADYNIAWTHAPIKPPVYTQEMADHEIKPLVGMDVELVIFENLTSCGHIEYKNEIGFLFRYKENNLCDFVEFSGDVAFKPLTPPKTDRERAIDDLNRIITDAYQDATDSYISNSRFKSEAIRLLDEIIDGEIYGVLFQPVTVETK
jgi:hypothetical protein